ncbi:unnamed protein product, partial [Didymodactylos carnosus]
TNCEDSTVTIPFHCRRLAPLVSLDPLLLNCKTIERGGKIEFPGVERLPWPAASP